MTIFAERFAGRTAVITGGASGLGLDVARRIAGEGGRVVLWDFDREALDRAAEELDAMLNLPPGSVTPLGALNDAEGRVPVIIDAAFKESLIGVPLLTNTATIWLNGADLARMLAQQGHKVNWLAL